MWTLADKYNIPTPERETRELLKRLRRFDPFIYKHSRDRSSYYIHFRNLPNKLNHKLRVSNHDERERYGYKWQLRLDGIGHVTHRKEMRRYFDDIDNLVNNFERYYGRVEELNKELLASSVTSDTSRYG
jgi:hypothetical protein